MELCSERTPLVPGMKVFVAQQGSHLVTGVFESLVGSSSSSSSNPVAALVTGVGVVDLCRLYSAGDVRCSQHAIRQAKLHAKSKHPGARVEAATNDHCGIDPPRAGFVANFLRDKSVVEVVEASLENAKKGVKYRLKQRWSLYQG